MKSWRETHIHAFQSYSSRYDTRHNHFNWKMKSGTQNRRSSSVLLKPILAFVLLIVLPWGMYYYFRQSQSTLSVDVTTSQTAPSGVETNGPLQGGVSTIQSNPQKSVGRHESRSSGLAPQAPHGKAPQNGPSPYHNSKEVSGGDFDIEEISIAAHERVSRRLPVLGDPPVNGTRPVFGKHTGRDAIFALACKYPVNFYQRFVGTLRKFAYSDDIVLAVSPPAEMKPGVEEYVKRMEVVAYAFDVDCAGKDNCRLKTDFYG